MTAKLYWGKDINVTFDATLCLHAAECLRGAPEVFDVHRKPWVLPDAADPALVADVVERCPAGALRYEYVRPYMPSETAAPPTQVVAKSGGPLWLHGPINLVTDDAATPLTRVALCRCGQSANPPYCDAAGPCQSWHPPKPR
ncbi:MAG: (4Fe-4S)-binding protein [Bifidobacteriaceae bacterium]|jgi:uncharacterized Fe-S cluster protein YjdI|nr:(4Fe-4S)-binding protein [Bifidobacteriaceae bacterium]